MEIALQALNIALVIQDKILIRDISLLISDTIGQFDPVISIIYLTLSQVWALTLETEKTDFSLPRAY